MAWDDPKAAPDPLAAVQDFVNTAHRMRDTDELRTADRASTVLAELGLVGDGEYVDDTDRRRLVRFREALRAVLLARTVREGDVTAAATALDRAVDVVPVRVRFSPAGRPAIRVAPDGSVADRAVAALLAAITAADREGHWERLKACANDACRWAFYDASRNRSGRWCDMNVCGARHKMRTYRERHR